MASLPPTAGPTPATPSRPVPASLGVGLLGLLLGGGLTVLVGTLDPIIVTSGGLAVAALSFMIVHPEVPVHVVLFVVYTNVGVVAALQRGLPGAIAGGVLALLAIPVAHHLVIHRRELRTGVVFGLMLVLLGIFALSAARAVDAATSVARMATYAAEGLAVYLLVVNVVRTEPTLRRVVATLLVAGGVLGGLTLYQGVTGSYDRDFGGLAQTEFTVDDVPVRADDPAVADRLMIRARGPLAEPNRFAQILIVLLPLALFQLRFGRSGPSRALGLATGFLILAGVLLSYSRGAFLTLTVMVALFAALGYVRPSRIVLTAVVLLLAAPLIAPGIYERVGTISAALDVLDPADRVGAEPVARGRTTETLAALYAFLDHPFLGVGPGHYMSHYSVRYQLDPEIGMRYLPEPRRAHNLYTEVAAESGLPGLLTFVAMPLALLVMLWRRRSALLDVRPDLAYLATGFGLAILGYLGTGVFLHLAFERYYWLLLALAAAACHVLSGEMEDDGDEIFAHPEAPVARYSSRSTTIGSTRVARRAGIQLASAATPSSTAGTAR